MELTRRDALRAFAVGGGAAGVSLAASEMLVDRGNGTDSTGYAEGDIETLYRVAEVVYPSEVEVTRGFIGAYVRRLPDDRQTAISQTVSLLNSETESRYGQSFTASTSADRRDSMLRSLGVHRVESTPDGGVPERIRYHLVNTLLYALFTTPRGSKLVGIESPRGHPGGFAVYREADGT